MVRLGSRSALSAGPLAVMGLLTLALGCGDGGGSEASSGAQDGGASSAASQDGSGNAEAGEGSGASADGSGSGADASSGNGDGDGDGDADAGSGGSSNDGEDSAGSEDASASGAEAGDGDGDGDGAGDGDGGDGDGAEASAGSASSGGDGDGDSAEGSASASASSASSGGDGDGDGDLCECALNTDLVYVLSDDAELWSFDPVTLSFEQVTASLGCPTSSTFSMSVSRAGLAHIMFQTDEMYVVDVNNPSTCIDPDFQVGQQGFFKFGMGFVSESEENPCDSLYAHSWSGGGGFSEGPGVGMLGVLDPQSLSMSTLGSIDYDGGELTGTGDGRLFAFAGAPAKLIEYDKSDAGVLGQWDLGLSLTNAFAFAFYGGDFYLFTESDLSPQSSKVTHYDFDGGQTVETVVALAPIRIVGAGVSTCAPLEPQ